MDADFLSPCLYYKLCLIRHHWINMFTAPNSISRMTQYWERERGKTPHLMCCDASSRDGGKLSVKTDFDGKFGFWQKWIFHRKPLLQTYFVTMIHHSHVTPMLNHLRLPRWETWNFHQKLEVSEWGGGRRRIFWLILASNEAEKAAGRSCWERVILSLKRVHAFLTQVKLRGWNLAVKISTRLLPRLQSRYDFIQLTLKSWLVLLFCFFS